MTDAPAPLLEARAIHVWRGDRHLLRGVSFQLHAGEFLQVTGPNGVGKSTLLRAACGLLPLEGGEFHSRGALIDTQRDEFDSHLAYLAHSNALKADLTAEENLRFELTLRRKVSAEEVRSALELMDIPQCANLPMRVLSAGQRRRLSIARVMLCKSSLWILDEPSTNLDAAGESLLAKLMTEHLLQGGAILAAAHHGLLNGHPAVRNLELA